MTSANPQPAVRTSVAGLLRVPNEHSSTSNVRVLGLVQDLGFSVLHWFPVGDEVSLSKRHKRHTGRRDFFISLFFADKLKPVDTALHLIQPVFNPTVLGHHATLIHQTIPVSRTTVSNEATKQNDTTR